jgi:hypothetical protein
LRLRTVWLWGLPHDPKLNTAELDQVAWLQCLGLAHKQPLAIDKRATGTVKIAEFQRITPAHEHGLTRGHPPRRVGLLARQVDAWCTRQAVTEDALARTHHEPLSDVSAAYDLESPSILSG